MERCANPHRLASHLGGKVPHQTVDNARLALENILEHATSDDLIVVAGSLYLIGEIRAILQEISAAKSVKQNSQSQV